MTDTLKIKRIWISESSRYNAEKKEIEYFYTSEVDLSNGEKISANINLDEKDTNKILSCISTTLKRELKDLVAKL